MLNIKLDKLNKVQCSWVNHFPRVHKYIWSVADQKTVKITKNTQQREYQHTCIFKHHHILHRYTVTKYFINPPLFYTHGAQNNLALISQPISPKIYVIPTKQHNLS
jgi:hypothetical protein